MQIHSSSRQSPDLSRHLIRRVGVECVPRRGELIRHHVAEVHEALEAFLEGFDGIRGIFEPELAIGSP